MEMDYDTIAGQMAAAMPHGDEIARGALEQGINATRVLRAELQSARDSEASLHKTWQADQIELTALAARVREAEQRLEDLQRATEQACRERDAAAAMAADYGPLLSEIDDIAKRIGIAATPEWCRSKLEELVSRHRRWNPLLASPSPAASTEGEPSNG